MRKEMILALFPDVKLIVWDSFVLPSINWEEKGARVQKIMEQLQMDPKETFFIDDKASYLEDALHGCDGLRTFLPEEFLEWIHKENSDVNQAAQ
jgi:predicted enzyme involved in methoxymalonyl-ACP biosynthesis